MESFVKERGVEGSEPAKPGPISFSLWGASMNFAARLGLGLFTAATAALASLSGCSSGGGDVDAGPSCVDTQCKQGNRCITDGKTLTCRLTCTTNDTTQQGSCPLNYTCVDAQGKANTPKGDAVSYCAKDTNVYKQAKGIWGDPCSPTKGFDTNPDCDSSQNFYCYGVLPTDGNAFCTQYDCTQDSDCRAGWWCASINSTPNVTTSKRTFGPDQVRSVCLPRTWNLKPGTYCAPCKTDLDCPLNENLPQHCLDPGDGNKVCSTECTTDKNCTLDAACKPNDDLGVSTCMPRASTCGPFVPKGDAPFCSPCHSDKDCGNEGYCVSADNSTEHFCTQKSKITCTQNGRDCPAGGPTGTALLGVGCTYSALTNDFAPKDQCYGVVQYGTNSGQPSPAFGCWTVTRK